MCLAVLRSNSLFVNGGYSCFVRTDSQSAEFSFVLNVCSKLVHDGAAALHPTATALQVQSDLQEAVLDI